MKWYRTFEQHPTIFPSFSDFSGARIENLAPEWIQFTFSSHFCHCLSQAQWRRDAVTQREILAASLRHCSMHSTVSMWLGTQRERKNALYILKDSGLGNLMVVLWSYQDVLESEKVGSMYCHGNTLISESYPFRQVSSILGSACSWGMGGHEKCKKPQGNSHMCGRVSSWA